MVLALALLVPRAGALLRPETLGLHDFVAYWSAGRVNAQGGNPYAPEELLPVQREVGWTDPWPNIMYYPPWVLPLVMPFGMLSYGVSRLLWLIANLGVVLFCADWIWRYYGGPAQYRWLACALALVFMPTLIVLRMGQAGPLLLLGVVGFLHYERRGRGGAAGAALLLAAIKPQLLYLFGLAVVVWAVDRRRWSVPAGGALAAVAAILVALACNPSVLGQYRYAVGHPPSGNITPTIGAFLRLAFGEERTWLQWLPTLVGAGWVAWYWSRHRRAWDWSEQAPVLVFGSFLTTAYGAWVFDLVVLLLPLVRAAVLIAHCRSATALVAIIGFAAIDGTALAMNLAGASYPTFIWMTPTLLVGYLLLRRSALTQSACAAAA
jgi:hypothetical protein